MPVTSSMLSNIIGLFSGPHDVARFHVGPADLATVQQRIDQITVKDLRECGFSSLPSGFHIVDEARGIIQFGPTHARRGNCSQPIGALEKAIGARRLPEPIHTVAVMHPRGNKDAYSEMLVKIFSALHASGATLEHKIDPKEAADAVHRGHFYSWLTARFSTDTTELTIMTSTRFDLSGDQFRRVELGNDGDFWLQAALVRKEDQDSLGGYQVLETGLRQILRPLVAGESAILLEQVDPSSVSDGWRYSRKLRLSVKDSSEATGSVTDLNIDSKGRYFGRLSSSSR